MLLLLLPPFFSLHGSPTTKPGGFGTLLCSADIIYFSLQCLVPLSSVRCGLTVWYKLPWAARGSELQLFYEGIAE